MDKELKKLLLETELSLLDTRVSLHSLPDRNGPCGHSPVTVSLVLGALTVGNLSEEGEDTPAPAVPEPEQAPGSGESGQEFQKRVSFEGLRIELSRACVRTTSFLAQCYVRSSASWSEFRAVTNISLHLAQGSDAGSERNTTVIAHLRPHTPNTPDHLDIVYRKLAESDESRSRRRLATSPSKSLQVTGRFGELRAVLVRSTVNIFGGRNLAWNFAIEMNSSASGHNRFRCLCAGKCARSGHDDDAGPAQCGCCQRRTPSRVVALTS